MFTCSGLNGLIIRNLQIGHHSISSIDMEWCRLEWAAHYSDMHKTVANVHAASPPVPHTALQAQIVANPAAACLLDAAHSCTFL